MGQHALALAGPAHETAGMPVRELDRGPPAGERRAGRDDRQVGEAERHHGRLDEEPEPVRDDLDRDPGRLRAPDERREPRVVRLGGGRREESAGSASTSAISSVISRREPVSPAS